MKIDFDQIRELLAVVGQTDITELTIESGDEKVTVKKSLTVAPSSTTFEFPSASMAPAASKQAPMAAVPTQAKAASTEPADSSNLVPITSPMVGTYYRSPSPSAPSFVNVGDRITVGQTICIIEAMKLMNDLPAEISGRITKVCVENGTTVEFGQTLYLVDPKG